MQYALLAFSFLLGAIPFGLLIARSKGVDILSVGSGNIGATNVWRTLGPGPGTIVMLLDMLKGAIPAFLGKVLLQDDSWSFGLGLTAVLGHSLSPFLKFKGGKGIATGCGALLGSNPLVGGICLAVFGIVLGLTRYVSLGSICAVIALASLGFILKLPMFVTVAYVVMAAFIIFKHKDNVKRLINGTERKFNAKGRDEKVDEDEGNDVTDVTKKSDD